MPTGPSAPEPAFKASLTFSWLDLWSRPGPQLAEAARRGEIFVARLRLTLVVIVSLIPLAAYLSRPVLQNRIGLIAGLFAVLLAYLLLSMARRGAFPSGIGLVSSLIDVTLISSVLFAFVVLRLPAIAVNSRIIYPMYFLAIMSTCLRYDSRVSLAAGATAVVQYAAVVLSARSGWTEDHGLPASYGAFDATDQAARLLLLAIATVFAALFVIRARQLLVLSTRDLLTGLFNRGFFDDRLLEEVERAKRIYRPVTLAMLDLDHFKEFNDSRGHRAGDKLLKAVATALRDSFRSADTVARYGGDEFAIIAADSGADEVGARLQEVREIVKNLVVTLPEGAAMPPVTVSIGLASWPRDGQTAEDVLICADRRLYEVKRKGGDDVVGPPPIAQALRKS
jgi:two-component system, cell cycle response regulator